MLGGATLNGRDVVQVQTTVAGADMIRAITSRGRGVSSIPPTGCLMWLDADTLVPVRLEVFATDTPQRDLWRSAAATTTPPTGPSSSSASRTSPSPRHR